MSGNDVRGYIKQHSADHIELIQSLVRQPSVSLEGNGLDECADLVRRHLEEAGAEDAVVVDLGDGFPGVCGHIDAGAPATLLCYGHYDVRPVGTERWEHEPFGAELVQRAPFGRVLVGRGSAASKGPLQAFLNAVASIKAVDGRLPVNLTFLIEGAEILGSPNYLQIAERQAEFVRNASALYAPRVSQDATGKAGVVLGYKGLIYLEIEANSATWGRGPQGGPVHSASSAVVNSPAWRLVQALATMVDATGTRLTMPQFATLYANRKPLENWERPLVDVLRDLAAESDLNCVIPGLSTQYPVSTFSKNMRRDELIVEYMYAPSVNLSGIRSGYTGPGTKSFLLPSEARATIDIRMITELDAQEVIAIIRKHLDDQGFPDIRVTPMSAYNWGQTPIDSDLVVAALETLRQYGMTYLVWPMVAFGGPWAHIPSDLGVPALLGAAPGLGDRAATSDEFMVIDGNETIAGLESVECYFADFLYKYASLHSPVSRGTDGGVAEEVRT